MTRQALQALSDQFQHLTTQYHTKIEIILNEMSGQFTQMSGQYIKNERTFL